MSQIHIKSNKVAKCDRKSPIVKCAIIEGDEWCLRCHCDGCEGGWTAWLECDRPGGRVVTEISFCTGLPWLLDLGLQAATPSCRLRQGAPDLEEV